MLYGRKLTRMNHVSSFHLMVSYLQCYVNYECVKYCVHIVL